MTSPVVDRTRSRIPELDGIRGVAILLVILFHYFSIPQSNGWIVGTIGAIRSLSWSGVDLFFVLSGFLIGGILMDHHRSATYFRTFYVRRVCRIVPLYFVWIVLFLVLPLLLPSSAPAYSELFTGDIPHFPKWGYFLFLQNFYTAKTGDFGSYWLAATWSLAVEEQFYLLLPALLWFVFPRRALATLLLSIALVPILRVLLFLFRPEIFTFVLFPCRADALLLGVLCAYLLRHEKCRTWLAGHKSSLRLIFLVLLAGVGYLAFFFEKTPFLGAINSIEMATFGFSLIALFYACLLIIVMTKSSAGIAWAMRVPLLRQFGIVAYGMYLFHRAIGTLMENALFGRDAGRGTGILQTLVAFAAFLVTWGLASLSWRFFERPIIRWGQSFGYRKDKTTMQSVEPCGSGSKALRPLPEDSAGTDTTPFIKG